jgi:cysteine desulfurase
MRSSQVQSSEESLKPGDLASITRNTSMDELTEDAGCPQGSAGAATEDTGGVFLDNNSTTRLHPKVIRAMVKAMESRAGNASSAHDCGILARRMLAEAREHIANLCGTASDRLIFTSGATEANNLVLQLPLAEQGSRIKKVVTSTIEHSSVKAPCSFLQERGVEVIWVPPSPDGRVSVRDIEAADLGPDTLVSLHWVNNETGVIQPIDEVAQLVKANGATLHVDGAQALGRLNVKFDSLGIDYLTASAHKLHGPQGIGVMIVRDGAPTAPLMYGGGQESGTRPGTENLTGIVGFGAAASLVSQTLESDVQMVGSLRDALERGILARIKGAALNGSGAPRVAGTTNIRFPGVDGQALVALLNQRGVFVSQSSACTNMRPEPSYVLRAMGLSEDQAYESIRACLSNDSTRKDVGTALDAIAEVVEILGGELSGTTIDQQEEILTK